MSADATSPSVGAALRCPVETTAGREFRVTVDGLSVEINFPGPRVPCWLAADRAGREYLLIRNDAGRIVSSHHRTIQSCREVEDAAGSLVSGTLKQRVDAALRMAP